MLRYGTVWPQVHPLQGVLEALGLELRGLFQVYEAGIVGRRTIAFSGRMLLDADSGYEEIQRRFRRHGFTPMLSQRNGEDLLTARQGVLGRANTGNPLVNLALLLITVATTLSAGTSLAGQSLAGALQSGDPGRLASALWAGIPFAATLLGILAVHELGHYVAARRHGVAATLPYFIPMPFSLLGTLGAFIALKSPLKNRKALFDIGLAGPLAGLAVAFPLLIVGTMLSEVTSRFSSEMTLATMGSSVLVDAVVSLLKDVPADMTLATHPVFFAAWIGLLLTGINLLPMGQLDGGHVAYALFGQRAYAIAAVAFVTLLLAGLTLSFNWFIWAFFGLLGGLRHPPPANDLSRLGPGRRLIGFLTILLFALIIIPAPFAG